MYDEIRLNVGGIVIQIRWENSQIVDWPDPRYEEFISAEQPDVSLRVHCGRLPECKGANLIFDGEKNWGLYQNEEGYIVKCYDPQSHRLDNVAIMSEDFRVGDYYILPKRGRLRKRDIKKGPGCYKRGLARWSLFDLMNPFFKLLLVNLLTSGKGVLVHGCGVIDCNSGMAFVGPTEAGKSTIGILWREGKGATVLSDEYIIITKNEGKFYLTGTPWHSDALRVSSKAAELRKVYFIYHAKENIVTSEHQVESFNQLFPQLFLPFWDDKRLKFAVEFCNSLIQLVDCQRLGFVNDEGIVDFLRGEVRGYGKKEIFQTHSV